MLISESAGARDTGTAVNHHCRKPGDHSSADAAAAQKISVTVRTGTRAPESYAHGDNRALSSATAAGLYCLRRTYKSVNKHPVQLSL